MVVNASSYQRAGVTSDTERGVGATAGHAW